MATFSIIDPVATHPNSLWEQAEKLHAELFNPGWSANDWRLMAENEQNILFAAMSSDEELMGLFAGQQAETSMDILTLFVDRNHQRKAIGTALLDAAIYEARICGIKHIFLEVASSNIAALTLYKSKNFVQCGLRKDYYGRHENGPREDALILQKTVGRIGE